MSAVKGLDRRVNLLERKSKRPGRIFFVEPGQSVPASIGENDKVVIWQRKDLTKGAKQ